MLQGQRPIREDWQSAEAIPLDVLFEDEEIIVVNKPAGLVVHPGAGNADGTLVNGLLNHRPDLNRLPRAGVVHRLDKETSGIMVVAASPGVSVSGGCHCGSSRAAPLRGGLRRCHGLRPGH